MNYHIEIENLGAIEKAKFEITPMTILAGKNGTGKSFVTKFLYSVLNLLRQNLLLEEFKEISNDFFFRSNQVIDYEIFQDDLNNINIIKNIQKTLIKIPNLLFKEQGSLNGVEQLKIDLKKHIKIYTEKTLPLIQKFEDKHNEDNFSDYQVSFFKTAFMLTNGTYILKTLNHILSIINEPQKRYSELLKTNMVYDLKDNFQIPDLKQLIHFGREYLLFIISDIIEIKINKESDIYISLISQPKQFTKFIFFESPVYWKLLSIIDESNELLTGIPQHFHDLRELLFTNFKNGERPQFIIDCANNLEQSLQGKFRTTLGSDLVFENKQGQAIDKSLVSFGMTNLGILQAVLNKNIINKGSFIFIDEPESNLHPEWQTLLAETLVYLAKNGVYVIITSHSTDMLKAFDVATQEQKLQDKLSAHYFQMDGTLLEMNDEHLTDIEQARQKLMENYDDLTMRGYLL